MWNIHRWHMAEAWLFIAQWCRYCNFSRHKEVLSCLDVEVLSDKCQQCLKWSKKQNDSKYQEWKAKYQCKINHTGSSGSMETAGALKIFERSCATRGLKCKDMLGDGDSSTYSAILESKTYGEDCIPRKLECIGGMSRSELETDCGISRAPKKAENSRTAKEYLAKVT